MSGPARDIVHCHVGRAGADGDAVVSGANIATQDVNEIRIPDVDAIGVRAIARSYDCHILHGDVIAPIDGKVNCLAVERSQPTNHRIVTTLEGEGLQS